MNFRQIVSRLRRSPALNRPATALLRATLPAGRLRRWCVEHLPRVGIVGIRLQTDGRTCVVRMHSGDDWLTSRMYWDGAEAFEPEVLLPFLAAAPRSRATLDIGAYTGWYSLLSSATNPDGRVFAYEANPTVALALAANLELNEASGIQVGEYAISDAVGTALFHLGSEGLPSSSSLQPEWSGMHISIEVPTRTIDDLMSANGDPPVDLVKIDIEGAEGAAVRGMTGTIRRCAPTMIIELLPDHRPDFLPVARSLTEEGYRCHECRPDGLVAIDPAAPEFLEAEGINFLFVSDRSRCSTDLVPLRLT